MAAESFKIYSLQQDGTRIPAMVSTGQTSVEENISASSIKEMTTAELTAMSIVARRAMYEDGIRLLRVYNSSTTVLLSLDANGKTSWAGGCYPQNLLDNSNFEIAQAGYDGYHGAKKFHADRWEGNGTGAFSISGAVKTFKSNSNYAFMKQNLWADGRDYGKTYTLAVTLPDGSRLVKSGTAPSTSSTSEQTFIDMPMSDSRCWFLAMKTTGNVMCVRADASQTNVSLSFQNIALYEGEYTVDTLPPYVPKGYAAELVECKRYFQKNTSQGKFFGDTAGYAGYVYVPYEQEMRTIPTLNVTAHGSLLGEQVKDLSISSTPIAVNSSTTGMTVQVPNSSETYILCVWSEPSFTLNADL